LGVREPFVGGADTMIYVVTAYLPKADQGFLAVFSTSYFPDALIVLEWVREEGGGNVCRWAEKGWWAGCALPSDVTCRKHRRSPTCK
jgi:hypothetical protein